MEHGTHLCSFIVFAELCAEYSEPVAPAAFIIGETGGNLHLCCCSISVELLPSKRQAFKKRKYDCLSNYPEVFCYKNALIC